MQKKSIDQQNLAARRGLMLGLTLAEIMLLVIIALLLLLGAQALDFSRFEPYTETIERLERTVVEYSIPRPEPSDLQPILDSLENFVVFQAQQEEEVDDTWQTLNLAITGMVLRHETGQDSAEMNVLHANELLEEQNEELKEAYKELERRNEAMDSRLAQLDREANSLAERLGEIGTPPPCIYYLPDQDSVELHGSSANLGTVYIEDDFFTLVSINEELRSEQFVDFRGRPLDLTETLDLLNRWPLGERLPTGQFRRRGAQFKQIADQSSETKLRCNFTMAYVMEPYVTNARMLTDVFEHYFLKGGEKSLEDLLVQR